MSCPCLQVESVQETYASVCNHLTIPFGHMPPCAALSGAWLLGNDGLSGHGTMIFTALTSADTSQFLVHLGLGRE
eukprot:367303-Amphidinium_carterae.1